MGFDADLVLKEITETRQWKIVIDDKIACILPSHLKTKHLERKNSDKAVYFHRIVTHPAFKGQQFVKKLWIGAWLS
jgi:hypothetical protein